MTPDHTKDYNNFAVEYTNKFLEADAKSRDVFTRHLPSLAGKAVIDVGCGSGHDVATYTAAGARAFGVDPAERFIVEARSRWPGIELAVGAAEQLPVPDASFDVYTSVYALQNADVPAALAEAARVLRPGGELIILTKHPMRQFLEKKSEARDYWTRENVPSTIFGGTIPLNEPSQTLEDYLSPEFMRSFDITHFEEGVDFPASDRVGEQNYPCYFILKARRR